MILLQKTIREAQALRTMERRSTVPIRTPVLVIPTAAAQILRHPQTVRMTTLVVHQVEVLLVVRPRLPTIQMIRVILLEVVLRVEAPPAADLREAAHEAVVQPVQQTVALVMEPTAPP